MELTPGTLVAERFRLERLLGKGGMGGVWRAHHVRLDVPCAVKFIHPEAAASAELRARFEREARAAAQIRSPNVVQILDHGVWQDLPYIAMELLVGEDLAARLKRRKPLPPREVLAIAAQVGKALTKAHAAGVVHRDLKPGNIYLAQDDDEEIVKVLDFGVAKDATLGLDSSTKTGAILGTPFYMSPEQARGNRAVDHRSDLWALAVVVYQSITGKLPFHSDAIGDLFVKIIVEPVPVPSQIAYVPPGFDAWWARATARDPADRFQSAKDLVDALGPALGLGAPEPLKLAQLPPPNPPPAPAHQLSYSAGGTVAMSPGTPLPRFETPLPAQTPPPYAGTPMPYAGTPLPYGSSTPMPAATPMPHAATPVPLSGAPAPVPPSIAPPTPTPVDQALTVHDAPPTARRTGIVVVATAAALVAILGGVLLLKGTSGGSTATAAKTEATAGSATATAAQTAAPRETAAPVQTAAPADSAEPAPPPAQSATSAATAAPPSATPAPAHSAAPPGKKRPPPGKPVKDFGI
jgi:serine/threonine-protein kinase